MLKTSIAYLLIFGIGGLPALGVRGAAVGTTVGWIFECVLLLILVYAFKTPLAANPFSFFNSAGNFCSKFYAPPCLPRPMKYCGQFGITTYNAVYARIGTDAIAAVNINATIEELMFVLFIGLGNACSVMVGNKIGEGEKDIAFEYGRRFTILGVMAAIAGGIVVIFIRDLVSWFIPTLPIRAQNLHGLMLVYSLSIWLRVFNFMLFIGALRAGGDTRYAMFTGTIFHLADRRPLLRSSADLFCICLFTACTPWS